jgi:hypothetical protein
MQKAEVRDLGGALGRGVVACASIQASEVILRQSSYCWVLQDDQVHLPAVASWACCGAGRVLCSPVRQRPHRRPQDRAPNAWNVRLVTRLGAMHTQAAAAIVQAPAALQRPTPSFGLPHPCIPPPPCPARPAPAQLPLRCDHCARVCARPLRCSRCKLARYCCADHQRVAWGGSHREECAALSACAPRVPPPTVRMLARALWRMAR